MPLDRPIEPTAPAAAPGLRDARRRIDALPIEGYVNGLHNGKTCLHPEPTKHFGGTVLWERPLISLEGARAALTTEAAPAEPAEAPAFLLRDLRGAFVSLLDGLDCLDLNGMKVAELAIGSIDAALASRPAEAPDLDEKADALRLRWLCEHPDWHFIEHLCREFVVDSSVEFLNELRRVIDARRSVELDTFDEHRPAISIEAEPPNTLVERIMGSALQAVMDDLDVVIGEGCVIEDVTAETIEKVKAALMLVVPPQGGDHA